MRLPADTFSHPPAAVDGVSIRVVSPLALYQLRAGIANRGSFGTLSERQLQSMGQLRETFFPDSSDAELLPTIEPLP